MSKKLQITLFLSFALNIIFPLSVFAKVSINEVAWMGTNKSQYGEWIELHNDGTSPVDLKDAGLYEGGGKTLIIKLTKSIAPGGYYLVARSTPSMSDPVFGLADDLGSFGGSGLSNLGEYLVFKSASGEILDSIDAGSCWPAGDSESKQTMQRSSNPNALTHPKCYPRGWITATSTPRAVNVSNGSTDIPTESSPNTTSVPVGNSSSDPFGGGSTDLSSHTSQADLSDKKDEVKIFASAGRSRLALVDTPITFEKKLFTSKNDVIDGGDVVWSFGDGQSATGKIIVHSYKFPGDYVVVMNVTKNAESYVARTNVRVVPANLAITNATPNFVKIGNQSNYESNLGGWQLVSGHSVFTFPKDTIVIQGEEITVSREVIGFNLDVDQLELFSPVGNTVSFFRYKKDNKVVVNTDVSTSSRELSIATVLLGAEQKLLDAKRSLALQTQKLGKISVPTVQQVATTIRVNPASEEKLERPEAVQIIEKPRSFLKTVLNLPVDSFKYLRGLIF